jgi:1-deoxy-D-xylulose-5-phosphate synthase
MAAHDSGPIAVRYPRGVGQGVPFDGTPTPIPIGVGELLRPGTDVVLIGYGAMVAVAEKAADLLAGRGIAAAVVNARFAKPLDETLLLDWARRTKRVVTLEEASLPGGFGDAVLELLAREPSAGVRARCFGVPDRLFDHASRDSLLRQAGLAPDLIAAEVARWLSDEPRSAAAPLSPVGSNA